MGSAVPALFFILIGIADLMVWNCEYNGQLILAATTLAATGISVSIALWFKMSPDYEPSRLKILFLPWVILVMPALLVLFIGPKCDLMSVRNEAAANKR